MSEARETVKMTHQVRKGPALLVCGRTGFQGKQVSIALVCSDSGIRPALYDAVPCQLRRCRGRRLEDWKNEPRSCLALVLLLDQFPRNMFRGTARAFATDTKARELSRHAIASGFDRELSPIMRMFLYLPLEHSENLNDQLESVRLTSALVAGNPDYAEILQYAEQHLEIFRRFGRFPGRNHALGRQSTQEEMNFLKDQKWR